GASHKWRSWTVGWSDSPDWSRGSACRFNARAKTIAVDGGCSCSRTRAGWPGRILNRLRNLAGLRSALAISFDRPGRDHIGGLIVKLIWPWQDRQRNFSWLKAIFFALVLAPAVRTIHLYYIGDYQSVPMGYNSLTYWSGVWATVVLLAALAVTPAIRIL